MKKVHLICNAHLDPIWQWQWNEGAAAAISTFRVAADLCEQDGGYVFNHNEALLYEWVEEYEPELFARIQKLVKEKRWNIIGGWYLQPDCVMPSGESFIRQTAVGKNHFKEKFGVDPTTAINFDSFGHTRGLVQIMAKTGYNFYITTRPPAHFGEFKWKGFDGSEIVVHNDPHGYNSGLGHSTDKINNHLEKTEADVSLVLWGVGDHGGGPSKYDLEQISKMIKEKEKEVEIVHSTPEDYIKDLDTSKLPTKDTSLLHIMVGCYTSMVRIKQKHRLLENLLCRCEKMLAHSGVKYDKKELEAAEKALLLCEFHDVLPGSSTKVAEEDAIRTLDYALEIVDRLSARAFFKMCDGQKVAKDGEVPVLVYNPHPYEITTDVEAEFMLADQNWAEDECTYASVYDKSGKFVPTQNIKEGSTFNLDWRKRIVFRATLAPMSINRFDCVLEKRKTERFWSFETPADGIKFKNDRMSVEISSKTGLIDSYCVDGVEYVKPGSGRLDVFTDNADPWGMTVDSFPDYSGSYRLMSAQEANEFIGFPEESGPALRIIEDGDMLLRAQAFFKYQKSYAVITYTLPKNDAHIDVDITVLSNDVHRMVKYTLDSALDNTEFWGQTAFGSELMRKDGEVVFHKWCGLKSGDKALCVINDGTYGGSATGDSFCLSVLRTPSYCTHPVGRPLMPKNRHLDHIDIGERKFKYRITTDFENIDYQAAVLAEAPYTLSFFPPGLGEAPADLLTVDNKVILLSALKKQDDAYLIRLFNSTDKKQKSKITLWGKDHAIDFVPFEVKTFVADGSTFKETDMLGR